MFQKIVAWLIGKKILTATGQMDATSKAKIIAIVGVLLSAVPQIAAAWGHPIVIPDYVYKILAYAGLWAVRDAMPAKQA